MSRLWVRVIRKHRTEKQITVPCAWGEEREALREAMKELDLPVPLWLNKHEKEFASFRRTAFLPDHFIEEVAFDKLEAEFLDDSGEGKTSRDPRNDFS